MVRVPVAPGDFKHGHTFYHKSCGGAPIRWDYYTKVSTCSGCGQGWNDQQMEKWSAADLALRFEREVRADRVAYKLVEVKDGPSLYTTLKPVREIEEEAAKFDPFEGL